MNAPATPQISLPSRSGHITLRCCNFLTQLIFCDHPSALRRLPQWNFVLLAVKSPERVRANSPIEFLHDFLFPSPRARDTFSFRLDDILHTAASDSEDFGPALADALSPGGQEARPSAAYSELVDVLSLATEKLALDWPDELRESRASKLDKRFLSGAHSKPERRKLPFFSDLHREIAGSWKQPFSSRLTNAAAADFTNLVGSVEQGYTAMPVVEDTLASHLSPSFGSFLEVPPPPPFHAV